MYLCTQVLEAWRGFCWRSSATFAVENLEAEADAERKKAEAYLLASKRRHDMLERELRQAQENTQAKAARAAALSQQMQSLRAELGSSREVSTLQVGPGSSATGSARRSFAGSCGPTPRADEEPRSAGSGLWARPLFGG